MIDALLAEFVADARREGAVGVTFLCLGLARPARAEAEGVPVPGPRRGQATAGVPPRPARARRRPAPAGELVLRHGRRRLLAWTDPAAFSVGHAAEAWLCLLPAEARRFRVADARLAAALAGSGGVGGGRVARRGDRAGRPSCGAMRRWRSCRSGTPGGRAGPWLSRVASRSRASARTRVAARGAASALRQLGYPEVEVILWDVGQGVRGPGSGRARSPSSSPRPRSCSGGARRPGAIDPGRGPGGRGRGRGPAAHAGAALRPRRRDAGLLRPRAGAGRGGSGARVRSRRSGGTLERCGPRILRRRWRGSCPGRWRRAGRDSRTGRWSR